MFGFMALKAKTFQIIHNKPQFTKELDRLDVMDHAIAPIDLHLDWNILANLQASLAKGGLLNLCRTNLTPFAVIASIRAAIPVIRPSLCLFRHLFFSLPADKPFKFAFWFGAVFYPNRCTR